jgi:hypothetical protein
MIRLDIEQDIKRIKKRATWGCLALAVILIFTPICLISYPLFIKEKTLEVSHSPSNLHTIQVVEKGEAFTFGLSKVRIKYGWRYIDKTIGNDGATLKPSNVSVMWKNDNDAIVYLVGKEESGEVKIRFH